MEQVEVSEMSYAFSISEAVAQTQTPLLTTVLSSEAEFDALEQEWNQLLAQSEHRQFFLRWRWNRLWWRYYAPADGRLMLIACRNQQGALTGLAPFYLRERTLLGCCYLREIHFIGTGIGIKINEYMNLIARRGDEEAVASAVATYLQTHDNWDRLLLWGAPAAAPVFQSFHQALGKKARIVVCEQTHHIDTSADWESFRRSLGTKRRKQVEYYYRRLFREHVCEFRRVMTAEELEPAMDALVELHQARWETKGHTGSFRIPHFETFFRQAMRQSLAEGSLRLWTLSIDDRIAAAQVAFVAQGTAYYFQGGFDPAYARYGIGNVILWLCIQDCIASPETLEFDFMGGGSHYKSRWTEIGRELVEMELFRPGLRATLYTMTISVRNKLRASLRALIPASIRQAGNQYRRRLRLRRAKQNTSSD
jgi:CelD/BcsL family acetyltransferase involved in cellulose biosynthesis